jgi:hypothetical protein
MSASQPLRLRSSPCEIYQDDFSPARGNALQAAVASLFGLDLESVPNFIAMAKGYEIAIRDFCEGRGMDCVKLQLTDDHRQQVTTRPAQEYRGKLCILRGKSPRGDFGHVVVDRYNSVDESFDMIHDPHPEGTFLDANEKYGWCMFFREITTMSPTC